jgi:hypothetical protein
MANFTELATLAVRDQSSASIRRINAELKKLQATAQSLKSIQINFGGGLGKAHGDIRKLNLELRALQAVGRSAISIRLNTAGAQQQLAQLRASAQRPIAVATRAATTPRAAAGLGVLGRVGPFGVHVLGGTVGLTIASLHALAGAIGRATKEGVKQVDIGDTALNALQLKPGERSAVEAAIEAIRKAQPGTPGGALLNRGQLAQTLAETLPVAAYDPAAARFLAERQIELIKMEVQRGRSLDQAREASVKYIKGLELAGLLSDQAGKFDPVSATKYLDALKTIAPSIGAELSGEKFFQFWKYARSARYTLTPEGMQAGLLAAEEMGASSAGVALNQAVRQLAGQNVPKATLSELARLGLVTTKEVREGTTGKKKRTTTVVGEPLDEEGLRQNLWQFARDTLIPKMRSQGLDPNKPLDAVAFASRIASTATAKDIIAGAINRAAEIQREVERARLRDPRLAIDPRSMLIAAEGLGSQIRGALGEAVTAFEPILIPALQGVGGYLSELGADIRKATQGDKAAQQRLEGTAATALSTGALAMMAKGVVGQVVSAVSTPLGITAGIAGATAPGASDTARSLSFAGVGLNAAAQGLQHAAAAQLVAAGAGGLVGRLMPWLGTAGVIGLGATAGSAGPGSPGYDYGNLSEEARRLARELTVPQAEIANLNKELKTAEELLTSAKKVAEAFPDRQGTLGDVKGAQARLAAVQERIAKAKAEEARIAGALAAAKGEPSWSEFWKWLEQQHKPIVAPPAVQAAVAAAIVESGKGAYSRAVTRAQQQIEREQRKRFPQGVPLPRPRLTEEERDAAEVRRAAKGEGDKREPPGVAKTAAAATTTSVAQLATVSDSMTAFTAALNTLQAETPAWLATLDATPARFTTVFGTGATAIGGAGTIAADALAGRAPGIGSIIGNTAGDALAARAAAISVTIKSEAARPDAGGQQGPT